MPLLVFHTGDLQTVAGLIENDEIGEFPHPDAPEAARWIDEPEALGIPGDFSQALVKGVPKAVGSRWRVFRVVIENLIEVTRHGGMKAQTHVASPPGR